MLVKPNVELISITPDSVRLIEQFAKTSTGKAPTKDIETSKQFVSKLVKMGHWSVLRCANAMFRVKCSRNCSMQLLRSKFLNVCQESQRYKRQSKEFILPDNLDEPVCKDMQLQIQTAHQNYEFLVNNNIKREDARYVLPSGVTTNIMMSGNFNAWLDFLKLRTTSKAQGEIRSIAETIWGLLEEEVPSVFTSARTLIALEQRMQTFKTANHIDGCKMLDYYIYLLNNLEQGTRIKLLHETTRLLSDAYYEEHYKTKEEKKTSGLSKSAHRNLQLLHKEMNEFKNKRDKKLKRNFALGK